MQQRFLMDSYAARVLIQTPGTTSSFLRGDNTFTNILSTKTGLIISLQEIERNIFQHALKIERDQNVGFSLAVYNNDYGLYSTSQNRWILKYDSSTSAFIFYGNANTATTLASTGTTAQFWRGDNTWTNILTGPLNIINERILNFRADSTSSEGWISVDSSAVHIALPGTLELRVHSTDNSTGWVHAWAFKSEGTSDFAANIITGISSSTVTLEQSSIILRERGRTNNQIGVAYAPTLGFQWQKNATTDQSSGILYLDRQGRFHLRTFTANLGNDNTWYQKENLSSNIGQIEAVAARAMCAYSDEDGVRSLKDNYVRVFNAFAFDEYENININDLISEGNTFWFTQQSEILTAPYLYGLTLNPTLADDSEGGAQLAFAPSTSRVYFRASQTPFASASTGWKQIPYKTPNIAVGNTGIPVYVKNTGEIATIARYDGTAAKAQELVTTHTIWGQEFNGTQNITGELNITNADIKISNSGTTTRQIQWIVGGSDYARIAAGATDNDVGWLEIATADDGNEPIYVRQYSGTFSTQTRTLTLLDASGNTSMPGTVSASTFIGSLQGNADSATKLTTSAGSTTQPIYFNNGKPTATSYALNATVNKQVDAATNTSTNASRIAYYSGTQAISGGAIITNGNYLTNVSFLGIGTTNTSYNNTTYGGAQALYVVGNAYVTGSIVANNGKLVGNKGLTVQSAASISGGLTVADTGITITAGNLDLTNGNITLSNNGTLSLAAGTIWCGTFQQNTNGSGERQIGVRNGAGGLYLYSSASTTGDRGLYTYNSKNTSAAVITVNKDNGITFHGNASTATNASSADVAHSVDWTEVVNKPNFGTTTSTTEIKYAISDSYGGTAKYIELEAAGSNGYALNFSHSASGGTRNIYFNYALRNGTGNTTKTAVPTLANNAIHYHFCNYANTTAATILHMDSIQATGTIEGEKVFGSYWNDYAEYRASKIPIEPGTSVVETGDGKIIQATKRRQAGAHIVTDTLGMAIGRTATCNTPIAVAGRVMAKPYRARNKYKIGAPVCTAPDGTVDVMSWLEKIFFPEAIIGYVSEIPTYEKWNNVPVKGRIWINLR